MIRNYINSFLRFLGKHKAYSFNNIVGLSIGMASAILIYLWILDELSFDKFHENYDNISRIVSTWDNADGEFTITATAAPLAPKFEESFPEILESARFRPAISEKLICYGEKKFYENEVAFADKEFFRIFTHHFIQGSSDDPFPTVNSAVITENIAQKYFGDENPVGKMISLDEETIVTIGGVIENVPPNSHLHFDILFNFELLPSLGWSLHWENNSIFAYVLLSDNVDYPSLKSRIDTLTKELYPHGTYAFHLQPLADVHLRSSFDFDMYSQSEPTYQYIRIFMLIGIFILLISVINYINLSTARSTMRAREVCVRKVFGASRAQLIRQFMGESFFLSLLSYLIAMLIVEIALPQFNQFTGKEVFVDYSDASFSLGILIILVFTGIFSGAYPSLFLASYIPVKILQGDIKSSPATFRRVLVIMQFSIAMVMIVCAGIVFRQLAFIQDRNLGIYTDQVIYFNVKGNLGERYQSFREELLKYPGIKGVANSASLPTWNDSGTYGLDWDGKNQEDAIYMDVTKVDEGFIPTFGIEMAEGRNFSIDRPADSNNYILNESAIRIMQMEDPIGKRLNLWGMEGQIIGIMKDFNFKSLHREIEPLCLYMTSKYDGELYGYIFIKLEGSNIRKTLRIIESTWNEINPFFPLDYTFLDEKYSELYIAESRMRSLFSIFAALSIFLSCLGLYGLSSFMAENRKKEIGVRKALGAKSWQIMTLFSWDALKWILVSNLIAWPVAWIYMKQWLNDFAYRTSLNPWVFILSSLIVLFIAVLTLSFQAQRVSRINPAITTKYE
jgi:putative ABC transport system permease protein